MLEYDSSLLELSYQDKRFAVVAWTVRAAKGARVLARSEAARILGTRLHGPESAALRGLYMRLSAGTTTAQVQDQAVMRWLIHNLGDEGTVGRWQVIELDHSVRTPAPPPLVESPDARRIKTALARLGPSGFVHRGDEYRIALVSGLDEMKSRGSFETLSAKESRTLLKEMSVDPTRPEQQRTQLGELLELTEPGPLKPRPEQLLLIRRQRVYIREANDAPASTPSQLRKAQETHWIGVEAVDKDGAPVSGVRLELKLPAGELRSVRTAEDGIASIDRLPAGSVNIRVADLDISMWRPAGGAAATPVSEQGIELYKIRSGDRLDKIARRQGLKGWKTIWERGENEPLRSKRKLPNMVREGDEVQVPLKHVHEIVRETDATHRIVVTRQPKEPPSWSL